MPITNLPAFGVTESQRIDYRGRKKDEETLGVKPVRAQGMDESDE